MGLFGGLFEDSAKDAFNSFTGKSGADSAKEAAEIQAAQQQKVYELFQPYAEAGKAQLPRLATDATVQGYGNNIGDILNGGALNPLIKERQDAATAYMSARGLRRSGSAVREAANIPAGLSMQIEAELNRRRQSLVGNGLGGVQGAAGGLEGIGQALAGGKLGAAQSQTQGSQNMMQLATLAAMAYSDSRLKDNIEPIGHAGPLTMVSWRWNEVAKDFGLSGESVGFIAQDVQKLFPHHVYEINGMLAIDYRNLLKEVKHAN